MRPRITFAGVVIALSLAAAQVLPGLPVSASRAELGSAARERIAYWNGGYQRWNEIARDLIGLKGLSPPRAARAYAALSEAQWSAWSRETMLPIPGIGATEQAANIQIAAASQAILVAVIPDEARRLDALLDDYYVSRVAAGWVQVGQIPAAHARGVEAATPAIVHLTIDGGGDAPLFGPPQWGEWRSRYGERSVDPEWGTLRPWLIALDDRIALPEPPAAGSPTWNAALQELRQVSASLSDAQIQIAVRWAGGADGYSPPDLWNVIALDLIRREHVDTDTALRALAAMNLAMADTAVLTWRAKYDYGVMRPWQADPAIVMPIRVPDFPSYPSGHSAFSWAAARVLSAYFPAAGDDLANLAEEASMSRLYAGIHWRFDLDAGKALGQTVAELVLKRATGEP